LPCLEQNPIGLQAVHLVLAPALAYARICAQKKSVLENAHVSEHFPGRTMAFMTRGTTRD
jgi:hypothetical protein